MYLKNLETQRALVGDEQVRPESGMDAGRAMRNAIQHFRALSIHMLALLLAMLMCSGSVPAYSVLTHEEIVDLLWTSEIRPLLLQRYPGLSEEQITEAHAYAYGGAVIQDLGYYPFGSVDFSNLVHYVRTGDFVRETAGAEQRRR